MLGGTLMNMLPTEKRNADLQKLITVFLETGFCISEKVYSEPFLGHYLVVFRSSNLCVKFSRNRDELLIWLKSVEDKRGWYPFRTVMKMLSTDCLCHSDASISFGNVREIAQFLIGEHQCIGKFLISQGEIEIAERARKMEEAERWSALRSMGIGREEQ
jgi:hypothetical protein